MNDETNINTDETATPETAELETLRRENEELRSAARLRNAREAIVNGLTTAGAFSPELLFSAVGGRVQFDDDGRPVNADELVADLRREFPEQFAAERPAAAIDAGAGTQRQAKPLSRDALSRMSPDEIRRLDWAEVREVLSGR